MRLLFPAAIVVLGALTQSAFACLNDSEGIQAPHLPHAYVTNLNYHEPKEHWEEQVVLRRAVVKKNWSPTAEIDLSVALAHVGQYDEALTGLQKVERLKPGKYATAANLGTVYELKGDVPQALHWIQEGIRREPGSHLGTEWLHVRILQAKTELAKNPRWLQKNTVLDMNFGTGLWPQMPMPLPKGNGGSALTSGDVEKALQYQLHERLEFVKAPEPIMGNLLVALGDMLALRGAKSDAKDVFKLAKTYAPSQSGLVERRIHWIDNSTKYLIFGVVACLGLVGYGVYQLKPRKKREVLVG